MYLNGTTIYFTVTLIYGVVSYYKKRDFDNFLFYLVFAIIVRMIYDSYF